MMDNKIRHIPRIFKIYVADAPFGWLMLCAGAYIISPLAIAVVDQTNLITSRPIAASFLSDYPLVNNLFLLGHILFAIPALLIGPWMFHALWRNRHLWWHRQLGKAYIICCLLSASSGFCLALANPHSVGAKAGFATLAVLWFSFTTKAYYSARRRNFKAHRRWMIRSYALTYAFLMVKALGFMLPYAAMDLSAAITMRSWLCWVPNFLFAEALIRTTNHQGRFIGWGKKAALS